MPERLQRWVKSRDRARGVSCLDVYSPVGGPATQCNYPVALHRATCTFRTSRPRRDTAAAQSGDVAVLNIPYVGTFPPHPGGAAISCAQLLLGFVRCGHRVRALIPFTPAAAQDGDDWAARELQIEITRF